MGLGIYQAWLALVRIHWRDGPPVHWESFVNGCARVCVCVWLLFLHGRSRVCVCVFAWVDVFVCVCMGVCVFLCGCKCVFAWVFVCVGVSVCFFWACVFIWA